MTLAQLLAEASARLAAAGIEQPRREARLLLAHATGLDSAKLLQMLPRSLAAPGLDGLVARRAAREPMALIIGRQPFWSIELAVSCDTLVPRADSETLVEAALAAFPGRDAARVLDLGTGSGCLLLAVLKEFPAAFGVGVDISPWTAAMARYNAQCLGLAGRSAILCGNWADPLNGRFDLVLSNPPYIETAAIAGLMPEVAVYEPRAALDGGVDGLEAYRAIMQALPVLLRPAGIAILELGAGQARSVIRLAESAGLVANTPRRDLSGIERALTVRMPRKNRLA